MVEKAFYGRNNYGIKNITPQNLDVQESLHEQTNKSNKIYIEQRTKINQLS